MGFIYKSSSLFVLSIVLAMSAAEDVPLSYAKYQVLQVGPLKHEAEMKVIVDWTAEGTVSKVRLISDIMKVGAEVTLVVAPDIVTKFKDDIGKRGIAFQVKSTDLKTDIDRSEQLNTFARVKTVSRLESLRATMGVKPVNELRWEDELKTTRLSRKRRFVFPGCDDIEAPDYFMTNNEMNQWLAKAARCSSIARLFSIGQSYEGRETVGIVVNEWDLSKPAVWIDAGLHAREWITHSTAIYLIHRVLYGTDVDDIYLRDNYRWFILPNLNPDGYEYAMTTDRLWRKNRGPTPHETCIGTDLNRNYNFNWGAWTTSANPCMDIYGGSAPESEVETNNIMQAVNVRANNLQISVDLHSYGQLWLLPYGGNSTKPGDYDELKDIANKAVEAIKNETGLIYLVGQPYEYLYPVSGTIMDWQKAYGGIKYTFNPEIRPSDASGFEGFIPGPDQILPAGREVYAAIVTTCREVMLRLP